MPRPRKKPLPPPRPPLTRRATRASARQQQQKEDGEESPDTSSSTTPVHTTKLAAVAPAPLSSKDPLTSSEAVDSTLPPSASAAAALTSNNGAVDGKNLTNTTSSNKMNDGKTTGDKAVAETTTTIKSSTSTTTTGTSKASSSVTKASPKTASSAKTTTASTKVYSAGKSSSQTTNPSTKSSKPKMKMGTRSTSMKNTESSASSKKRTSSAASVVSSFFMDAIAMVTAAAAEEAEASSGNAASNTSGPTKKSSTNTTATASLNSDSSKKQQDQKADKTSPVAAAGATMLTKKTGVTTSAKSSSDSKSTTSTSSGASTKKGASSTTATAASKAAACASNPGATVATTGPTSTRTSSSAPAKSSSTATATTSASPPVATRKSRRRTFNRGRQRLHEDRTLGLGDPSTTNSTVTSNTGTDTTLVSPGGSTSTKSAVKTASVGMKSTKATAAGTKEESSTTPSTTPPAAKESLAPTTTTVGGTVSTVAPAPATKPPSRRGRPPKSATTGGGIIPATTSGGASGKRKKETGSASASKKAKSSTKVGKMTTLAAPAPVPLHNFTTASPVHLENDTNEEDGELQAIHRHRSFRASRDNSLSNRAIPTSPSLFETAEVLVSFLSLSTRRKPSNATPNTAGLDMLTTTTRKDNLLVPSAYSPTEVIPAQPSHPSLGASSTIDQTSKQPSSSLASSSDPTLTQPQSVAATVETAHLSAPTETLSKSDMKDSVPSSNEPEPSSTAPLGQQSPLTRSSKQQTGTRSSSRRKARPATADVPLQSPQQQPKPPATTAGSVPQVEEVVQLEKPGANSEGETIVVEIVTATTGEGVLRDEKDRELESMDKSQLESNVGHGTTDSTPKIVESEDHSTELGMGSSETTGKTRTSSSRMLPDTRSVKARGLNDKENSLPAVAALSESSQPPTFPTTATASSRASSSVDNNELNQSTLTETAPDAPPETNSTSSSFPQPNKTGVDSSRTTIEETTRRSSNTSKDKVSISNSSEELSPGTKASKDESLAEETDATVVTKSSAEALKGEHTELSSDSKSTAPIRLGNRLLSHTTGPVQKKEVVPPSSKEAGILEGSSVPFKVAVPIGPKTTDEKLLKPANETGAKSITCASIQSAQQAAPTSAVGMAVTAKKSVRAESSGADPINCEDTKRDISAQPALPLSSSLSIVSKEQQGGIPKVAESATDVSRHTSMVAADIMKNSAQQNPATINGPSPNVAAESSRVPSHASEQEMANQESMSSLQNYQSQGSFSICQPQQNSEPEPLGSVRKDSARRSLEEAQAPPQSSSIATSSLFGSAGAKTSSHENESASLSGDPASNNGGEDVAAAMMLALAGFPEVSGTRVSAETQQIGLGDGDSKRAESLLDQVDLGTSTGKHAQLDRRKSTSEQHPATHENSKTSTQDEGAVRLRNSDGNTGSSRKTSSAVQTIGGSGTPGMAPREERNGSPLQPMDRKRIDTIVALKLKQHSTLPSCSQSEKLHESFEEATPEMKRESTSDDTKQRKAAPKTKLYSERIPRESKLSVSTVALETVQPTSGNKQEGRISDTVSATFSQQVGPPKFGLSISSEDKTAATLYEKREVQCQIDHPEYQGVKKMESPSGVVQLHAPTVPNTQNSPGGGTVSSDDAENRERKSKDARTLSGEEQSRTPKLDSANQSISQCPSNGRNGGLALDSEQKEKPAPDPAKHVKTEVQPSLGTERKVEENCTEGMTPQELPAVGQKSNATETKICSEPSSIVSFETGTRVSESHVISFPPEQQQKDSKGKPSGTFGSSSPKPRNSLNALAPDKQPRENTVEHVPTRGSTMRANASEAHKSVPVKLPTQLPKSVLSEGEEKSEHNVSALESLEKGDALTISDVGTTEDEVIDTIDQSHNGNSLSTFKYIDVEGRPAVSTTDEDTGVVKLEVSMDKVHKSSTSNFNENFSDGRIQAEEQAQTFDKKSRMVSTGIEGQDLGMTTNESERIVLRQGKNPTEDPSVKAPFATGNSSFESQEVNFLRSETLTDAAPSKASLTGDTKLNLEFVDAKESTTDILVSASRSPERMSSSEQSGIHGVGSTCKLNLGDGQNDSGGEANSPRIDRGSGLQGVENASGKSDIIVPKLLSTVELGGDANPVIKTTEIQQASDANSSPSGSFELATGSGKRALPAPETASKSHSDSETRTSDIQNTGRLMAPEAPIIFHIPSTDDSVQEEVHGSRRASAAVGTGMAGIGNHPIEDIPGLTSISGKKNPTSATKTSGHIIESGGLKLDDVQTKKTREESSGLIVTVGPADSSGAQLEAIDADFVEEKNIKRTVASTRDNDAIKPSVESIQAQLRETGKVGNQAPTVVAPTKVGHMKFGTELVEALVENTEIIASESSGHRGVPRAQSTGDSRQRSREIGSTTNKEKTGTLASPPKKNEKLLISQPDEPNPKNTDTELLVHPRSKCLEVGDAGKPNMGPSSSLASTLMDLGSETCKAEPRQIVANVLKTYSQTKPSMESAKGGEVKVETEGGGETMNSVAAVISVSTSQGGAPSSMTSVRAEKFGTTNATTTENTRILAMMDAPLEQEKARAEFTINQEISVASAEVGKPSRGLNHAKQPGTATSSSATQIVTWDEAQQTRVRVAASAVVAADSQEQHGQSGLCATGDRAKSYTAHRAVTDLSMATPSTARTKSEADASHQTDISLSATAANASTGTSKADAPQETVRGIATCSSLGELSKDVVEQQTSTMNSASSAPARKVGEADLPQQTDAEISSPVELAKCYDAQQTNTGVSPAETAQTDTGISSPAGKANADNTQQTYTGISASCAQRGVVERNDECTKGFRRVHIADPSVSVFPNVVKPDMELDKADDEKRKADVPVSVAQPPQPIREPSNLATTIAEITIAHSGIPPQINFKNVVESSPSTRGKADAGKKAVDLFESIDTDTGKSEPKRVAHQETDKENEGYSPAEAEKSGVENAPISVPLKKSEGLRSSAEKTMPETTGFLETELRGVRLTRPTYEKPVMEVVKNETAAEHIASRSVEIQENDAQGLIAKRLLGSSSQEVKGEEAGVKSSVFLKPVVGPSPGDKRKTDWEKVALVSSAGAKPLVESDRLKVDAKCMTLDPSTGTETICTESTEQKADINSAAHTFPTVSEPVLKSMSDKKKANSENTARSSAATNPSESTTTTNRQNDDTETTSVASASADAKPFVQPAETIAWPAVSNSLIKKSDMNADVKSTVVSATVSKLVIDSEKPVAGMEQGAGASFAVPKHVAGATVDRRDTATETPVLSSASSVTKPLVESVTAQGLSTNVNPFPDSGNKTDVKNKVFSGEAPMLVTDNSDKQKKAREKRSPDSASSATVVGPASGDKHNTDKEHVVLVSPFVSKQDVRSDEPEVEEDAAFIAHPDTALGGKDHSRNRTLVYAGAQPHIATTSTVVRKNSDMDISVSHPALDVQKAGTETIATIPLIVAKTSVQSSTAEDQKTNETVVAAVAQQPHVQCSNTAEGQKVESKTRVFAPEPVAKDADSQNPDSASLTKIESTIKESTDTVTTEPTGLSQIVKSPKSHAQRVSSEISTSAVFESETYAEPTEIYGPKSSTENEEHGPTSVFERTMESVELGYPNIADVKSHADTSVSEKAQLSESRAGLSKMREQQTDTKISTSVPTIPVKPGRGGHGKSGDQEIDTEKVASATSKLGKDGNESATVGKQKSDSRGTEFAVDERKTQTPAPDLGSLTDSGHSLAQQHRRRDLQLILGSVEASETENNGSGTSGTFSSGGSIALTKISASPAESLKNDSTLQRKVQKAFPVAASSTTSQPSSQKIDTACSTKVPSEVLEPRMESEVVHIKGTVRGSSVSSAALSTFHLESVEDDAGNKDTGASGSLPLVQTTGNMGDSGTLCLEQAKPTTGENGHPKPTPETGSVLAGHWKQTMEASGMLPKDLQAIVGDAGSLRPEPLKPNKGAATGLPLEQPHPSGETPVSRPAPKPRPSTRAPTILSLELPTPSVAATARPSEQSKPSAGAPASLPAKKPKPSKGGPPSLSKPSKEGPPSLQKSSIGSLNLSSEPLQPIAGAATAQPPEHPKSIARAVASMAAEKPKHSTPASPPKPSTGAPAHISLELLKPTSAGITADSEQQNQSAGTPASLPEKQQKSSSKNPGSLHNQSTEAPGSPSLESLKLSTGATTAQLLEQQNPRTGAPASLPAGQPKSSQGAATAETSEQRRLSGAAPSRFPREQSKPSVGAPVSLHELSTEAPASLSSEQYKPSGGAAAAQPSVQPKASGGALAIHPREQLQPDSSFPASGPAEQPKVPSALWKQSMEGPGSLSLEHRKSDVGVHVVQPLEHKMPSVEVLGNLPKPSKEAFQSLPLKQPKGSGTACPPEKEHISAGAPGSLPLDQPKPCGGTAKSLPSDQPRPSGGNPRSLPLKQLKTSAGAPGSLPREKASVGVSVSVPSEQPKPSVGDQGSLPSEHSDPSVGDSEILPSKKLKTIVEASESVFSEQTKLSVQIPDNPPSILLKTSGGVSEIFPLVQPQPKPSGGAPGSMPSEPPMSSVRDSESPPSDHLKASVEPSESVPSEHPRLSVRAPSRPPSEQLEMIVGASESVPSQEKHNVGAPEGLPSEQLKASVGASESVPPVQKKSSMGAPESLPSEQTKACLGASGSLPSEQLKGRVGVSESVPSEGPKPSVRAPGSLPLEQLKPSVGDSESVPSEQLKVSVGFPEGVASEQSKPSVEGPGSLPSEQPKQSAGYAGSVPAKHPRASVGAPGSLPSEHPQPSVGDSESLRSEQRKACVVASKSVPSTLPKPSVGASGSPLSEQLKRTAGTSESLSPGQQKTSVGASKGVTSEHPKRNVGAIRLPPGQLKVGPDESVPPEEIKASSGVPESLLPPEQPKWSMGASDRVGSDLPKARLGVSESTSESMPLEPPEASEVDSESLPSKQREAPERAHDSTPSEQPKASVGKKESCPSDQPKQCGGASRSLPLKQPVPRMQTSEIVPLEQAKPSSRAESLPSEPAKAIAGAGSLSPEQPKQSAGVAGSVPSEEPKRSTGTSGSLLSEEPVLSGGSAGALPSKLPKPDTRAAGGKAEAPKPSAGAGAAQCSEEPKPCGGTAQAAEQAINPVPSAMKEGETENRNAEVTSVMEVISPTLPGPPLSAQGAKHPSAKMKGGLDQTSADSGSLVADKVADRPRKHEMPHKTRNGDGPPPSGRDKSSQDVQKLFSGESDVSAEKKASGGTEEQKAKQSLPSNLERGEVNKTVPPPSNHDVKSKAEQPVSGQRDGSSVTKSFGRLVDTESEKEKPAVELSTEREGTAASRLVEHGEKERLEKMSKQALNSKNRQLFHPSGQNVNEKKSNPLTEHGSGRERTNKKEANKQILNNRESQSAGRPTEPVGGGVVTVDDVPGTSQKKIVDPDEAPAKSTLLSSGHAAKATQQDTPRERSASLVGSTIIKAKSAAGNEIGKEMEHGKSSLPSQSTSTSGGEQVSDAQNAKRDGLNSASRTKKEKDLPGLKRSSDGDDEQEKKRPRKGPPSAGMKSAKPNTFSWFDVEKAKATLYKSGARVHGVEGYDRKFSDYWDAMAMRFKSPPLNETEIQSSRMRIKAFLLTRGLRVLHNRLVKGLLKRSLSSRAPLREVAPHVPTAWVNRIRAVSYDEDGANNDTKSMQTAVTKKRKIERAAYLPVVEESTPKHNVPAPSAENSLRVPGALSIDPRVRQHVHSANMKVSENAVWLLVVGAREYATTVLRSSINLKKNIAKGKVSRCSQLRPQSLMVRPSKKKSDSKEPASKKTQSKKLSPLTALDIHSLVVQMPMGHANSLGGTVSRIACERTQASAIDTNAIQCGDSLLDLKATIFQKLAPSDETKLVRAPSRGLGRGAKDLKSLIQRTNVSGPPTDSNESSKPAAESKIKVETKQGKPAPELKPVGKAKPSVKAQSTGKQLRQLSALQKVKHDASNTSGQETTKQPVASASTNPISSESKDQSGSGGVGRAGKGKGFGIKDLAAMRARTGTQDAPPTDSKEAM